jgi:hypothetical protein
VWQVELRQAVCEALVCLAFQHAENGAKIGRNRGCEALYAFCEEAHRRQLGPRWWIPLALGALAQSTSENGAKLGELGACTLIAELLAASTAPYQQDMCCLAMVAFCKPCLDEVIDSVDAQVGNRRKISRRGGRLR